MTIPVNGTHSGVDIHDDDTENDESNNFYGKKDQTAIHEIAMDFSAYGAKSGCVGHTKGIPWKTSLNVAYDSEEVMRRTIMRRRIIMTHLSNILRQQHPHPPLQLQA